jgi:hypothetical protein
LIRRRFESSVGAISGRLSRMIDRNGSITSLIRSRWIEILYVVGIVAMASGIVNAAIQPVDSRYIIFPGQGSQSITETVINALALMLGATGIYLSYLSGRQTTKPRMVTFYLILGLLLLGTGIYIGIYVYSSK